MENYTTVPFIAEGEFTEISGYAAMQELLIDVIKNGIKPSRKHIIDTTLVVRSSCGSLIHEGGQ